VKYSLINIFIAEIIQDSKISEKSDSNKSIYFCWQINVNCFYENLWICL